MTDKPKINPCPYCANDKDCWAENATLRSQLAVEKELRERYEKALEKIIRRYPPPADYQYAYLLEECRGIAREALKLSSQGGEMNGQVYFEVGLHKGEMDFGINGSVSSLTYEQMKSLREIIVVGIGVMEEMWRNNNQRSPAQCEKKL